MIRHNIVLSCPSVDMNMLISSTFLEAWTDIHVVKSLSVHVISVRVPLLNRHADNLIQLGQARYLCEGRERLNEGELVEVACGYDGCRGINGENLGNKLLSSVSFPI